MRCSARVGNQLPKGHEGAGEAWGSCCRMFGVNGSTFAKAKAHAKVELVRAGIITRALSCDPPQYLAHTFNPLEGDQLRRNLSSPFGFDRIGSRCNGFRLIFNYLLPTMQQELAHGLPARRNRPVLWYIQNLHNLLHFLRPKGRAIAALLYQT